MKLVTFPLKLRMKGAKVGDLQAALQLLLDRSVILRNDESARRALSAALRLEHTAQTYSSATRKLVSIFQEERRLQPTGEVDQSTAKAINALLRELGLLEEPAPPNKVYKIRGSVLSRFTGTGIAGLRVEAWEKVRQIRDVLGVANTDDKGRFELPIDSRYHTEIEARKPDIYFQVLSGQHLLLSTEDSILWNVKQAHLQVTISVDLLGDVDDGRSKPKSFIVRGRVAKAGGSPIGGLKVVAIEEDARSQERVLGTVRTDKGGFYDIQYAADQLANPVKCSADLIVKVFDDRSQEPLASSPLILNALEEEIINFSVGEEVYRGRSEYELVADRLQPLLDRSEKSDFSDQEIAYFSNQTGLSLEQVQLYLESRKQAQRTGVESGVLYALYRTGMPYSLAALTVQSPDAVIANLRRAQDKNIVAPLNDAAVTKTLESLEALRTKEILEAESPGCVQAAKLFDITGLTAEEKATLLKVYSMRPEPSETFWDDLREVNGLSERKVEKLRRIFEFNALSLGHLPLVEKLAASQEIKSVKNLASKDLGGWKDFLKREGIAAPVRMPGDTAAEKQANYALILSRIMEDAYPTVVFSAGWAQDPSLDRTVSEFFKRNPGFAFEDKGITTYLNEHPEALEGVQDRAAATFKLQALQNLFRISPRFDRLKTVTALWRDKLYSAHVVKRLGEEKFVAKYEMTIGKAQARFVYAKAEKVAGFTLLALAKYAWDTNAVTPYVIPKTNLSAAEGGSGTATLEALFGNLDFCHCEHCRSVLGPAAYLVDLLMFLNNATAKDGDTGLEKLFARRPDIGNIKLNCDNARTLLPYIDLVNEVLEDTIEPRPYTAETHDGTTVFTGEVYQTDEKRSEYLRAHPEHLNPASYEKLKTATYPWTLPFSLWAEEAKIYLAQLGVKRYKLMEVFSGSGAGSPTETEILSEALGLTPRERTLLTTAVSNDTQLKVVWGVKTGTVIDGVKRVADFIARADINYSQLEAVLQCRFINPDLDATDAIKISFDEANPCSLDHAELTNLETQNLDRLHRFIRLRKKLGWSFFDLDRALRAFGQTTIDDDLLRKLSMAVQLKERLGVDLLSALSWWSAKLDTVEYKDTPSQYEELCRSRASSELTEKVRNTLRLDPAGDELSATDKSMTDPDYEPVILGAARIRKDDLALIIAEDLGDDDTLNVANLSHVIRVASFSRAAGFSIREHYILSKLTGIHPLVIPAHGTTPQHTPALQDTKASLEARQTAAESGISLGELAYLLAHDTSQPNNGQLPQPFIAQRLTEIRTDLAAIHAAHRMPEGDLEAVLVEKLADLAGFHRNDPDLAELEKEETRNIMVRIVLGQSALSKPDQKSRIDKYFGKFLNATDAKDRLVDSPPPDDTAQARLAFVLEPLLAYLFPLQGRRYLEQKLSERLSGSVAAVSGLLDVIRDSSESAQEVLLAEAFVASSGPLDPTAHAAQTRIYERIYKASRLVNGLKIGPDDQEFVVRQGPAVGWPDINELPITALAGGPAITDLFTRFVEMVKVFQIWPRIRTSGAMLTEFLTQVAITGATEAQIKKQLAAHSAWSLDDIETLTTNYGFGATELQKTAWLVRLYEAFSILKRLGVRAAQGWSWNTAEVTFEQAAQIKLAVKSKYENKEWLSIASALRDPLREEQRDALLAYVIHDKDFADAGDVYGYLLIDPEMNACRDTSRIVKAISSVQLFVQRILMNLEADEIEFTHADAKQWKWRKNYRVWEANRKVFLWPENWIYPDLRDDKSPFFKELEDELYQSDIDNESAERALMSYLKKLDEVAHLEVSGLYEEVEGNILHVVARTRSTPHKYFYRRWINKQYWTAWERVEADIEGDHLVPVVHNRRLFLFWPKFIEKAYEPKVEDTGGTPSDPEKYYEIHISWTQYWDGKWRDTQVSKDSIETSISVALRPKNEFYFFAEQTAEGELLLRCRLIPFEPAEAPILKVLRYNDVTDVVETYKIAVEGLPPLVVWLLGMAIMNRNGQLNKLPDGDNVFMEFEKTTKRRELSLLTHADVDAAGFINPSTQRMATLLTSAEEGFWIMLPQQYPTYISQGPFFYSDGKRVFFVQSRDRYNIFGSYGLADAFTLSGEAYFRDAAAKIRQDQLAFAVDSGLRKGLLMGGDRPFFDGDGAHYVGNRAGGMVIDRGKAASPRAGRAPGVLREGTTAPVTVPVQPMALEHAREAVGSAVLDTVRMGVERGVLYDGLAKLGSMPWIGKRYRFQAFYHPYVPLMIHQLNRHGIEGLLAPTPEHGADWEKLRRQQARRDDFAATYSPNSVVVDLAEGYRPKEDFDFSFGGAYGRYNWELFFHAPLLIAERLKENQKFEEAQKWFHYIFDPTEPEGPAPKRFWQVKPFDEYDGETSIEKLMELLNQGDEEVEAQVEAWENDPFNPHLIARLRTVAYMRTVVMKYLDNLIDWGDSLFRRFSTESLNEATQIYALAAQILGRRPERIEKTDVSAYTFNTLLPDLDEFSNARVAVESALPWMTTHRNGSSTGESGVLDTLYFCLPENEKLLGYWDVVADRLFKLRHCMDIEGARRQPALFEPPIDPGLLVKARAMGLELSSILSDVGAPLPYYRFRVMLQRANEFCADVRNLGAALLSALEKRDAETLALIRAGQQVQLLKAVKEIKKQNIRESEETLASLNKAREVTSLREQYYRNREFMSNGEISHIVLQKAAGVFGLLGQASKLTAMEIALIPGIFSGTAGVSSPLVFANLSDGKPSYISATFGDAMGFYSSYLSLLAETAGTMAGYERRKDEWDFQAESAGKELEQLDKQVLAAEIRRDVAAKDLQNHQLQIEHAEAEAEFLETKFTNRELNNWMVTQVSTLYFQTYQIAYDLAKKAEQCFRHELGIRDTDYIQPGYWDSLKKGLLAGERLHKDLRRLEAAHLELNRREFELTKHISLAQLDPVALLMLKQTGRCEFAIPEIVFDLDHPGHYMRRIKSVSMTIPCVVGPYTGVTATLTMLDNRIRIRTAKKNNKYAYRGLDDERFVHDLVGIRSIATSSGQRDAGLFELSFGDERYLPFEGSGVVNGWRLELPGEYRQFDYDTISDVVLHIQYTARDGGDQFKADVQGEIRESLNKIADLLADSDTGLTRIISAAHDFGSEWHRFMHPVVAATSQEITFRLDKRLFPFMLKERQLDVHEITVGLKLDDPSIYSGGTALQIAFIDPDSTETTDVLGPLPLLGSQPGLAIGTSFSLTRDAKEVRLKIHEPNLSSIAPDLVEVRDNKKRLNANHVKDMLLVVNYTIAS